MSQAAGKHTPEIVLRRMRADDLAAGLRLTQAESWTHRMGDWQFHFNLGRGWVACDMHDQVLGTAMWWPYGDDFATLGLIVVDRSLQGQGVGRQLMVMIMNDAGSRVLQLVATNAGLKLYRQSGFKELGGIEQRQGTVLPAAAVPAPSGTRLRDVTHDDVQALCALDARVMGVSRDALISALVNQDGGILAERDGQIVGCALMRPAGRGTTIGPIIADEQSLAMALIDRCLEKPTGFTRVDIPAQTTELGNWLDTRGLVCVDRVTLMRRGELAQPAGKTRVFGLVSQALG
jgi:predicted N-acetyltransferase YhbS